MMQLKHHSDEELITLFVNQNEQEAFTILYQRYLSFVIGICMKYLKNKEDSEDVALQIFQKLYEKILKEQATIQTFKFWLYTVTKNAALSFLRTKNKTTLINFDEFVENTTFEHLDDNESELNWNEATLKTYLNELPEEQGLCLTLFYLEELSYKEIMAQTGLSYNTIKSAIQNGKRNLKKRLNSTYYEN